MKKQLLIAAVAATMASATFADISIKGAAFIKVEGNDNAETNVTTENSAVGFDIDVTGKTGDTAAYANIDIDNAATAGGTETSASGGTINVDKMWVTTKIGSVNVKAGDWSSCTGQVEGISACSTTNNSYSLSTDISDVTVGVSGALSDSSTNNSFSLSTKIAGMTVKLKENEDTYTNLSVAGDLAVGTGTGFYVEHMDKDAADSDTTLVAAHTSVGGVKVTVASLSADDTGATANNGDLRVVGSSLVGDYHTAAYTTNTTMTDVKAIGFNTDISGNNVNVAFINADTNGVVDDRDLVDVVVQRKLASGATLDMSYGKADIANAAGTAKTDTTNYGAQLTVKF